METWQDCSLCPAGNARCPSDDALNDMMLGQLDEESANAIESVVSDCPQCATRRETLAVRGGSVSALENDRMTLPRTFGHYELLEDIARDGMGIVYKARHTKLNFLVTLKMINSAEMAGVEEVQRFQSEAQAAAKLDHTNIVPIYEVGAHDGRHFVSMGFVDGVSLQDRLQDGPLPPRDAVVLLKTIAETVQYAHENGVVHHDLKPANVLLDVGGSPRVSGFGLANNIAADAIGKKGPQSDVYSLGVILYSALTGRPPFQPAGVSDTLQQARDREPVSPRQLNAAVDRDLDAICLKCLKQDSGNRYASARDLAGELDRFLRNESARARPAGRFENCRRLIKRNPLAATLTGIVVTLLVGGMAFSLDYGFQATRNAELANQESRETRQALKAARNAERQSRADSAEAKARLRETRRTIDQYVKALSESALLKEPRFQPLLKTLAKDATTHYLRYVEQHKHSPGERSNVAEALRRVGTLSLQSGNPTEARRALEHALTLLRQRSRDNPTQASAAEAIALCYPSLLDVYLQLGLTQEAERAYDDGVQIFGEVIANAPAKHRLQYRLGLLHLNMAGNYLSRRRLGKTLSSSRTAREILQRLPPEFSRQENVQRQIAKCHVNEGAAYLNRQQPAEAAKPLNAALVIRERLAKQNPFIAEYRADVAATCLNIGLIHDDSSTPAAALPWYRKAQTIYEELVPTNPTVTDFQKKLVSTVRNLGLLQKQLGNTDAAAKIFSDATIYWMTLAAANPEIPALRNSLAKHRLNAGQFFAETGQFAIAIEAYENSRREYQELHRKSPEVVSFDSGGAKAQGLLADIYIRLSEFDSARKSRRRELAIYRRLAAVRPNDPDVLSRLAAACGGLAVLLRMPDDADQIEKLDGESLEIWKNLANEHPNDQFYLKNLIAVYANRALRLFDAGNRNQALKEFDEAISLGRKLIKAAPDNPDYQFKLAETLTNAGPLYGSDGQFQIALRLLRESVDILTRLVRRNPKNVPYRECLVESYVNLGATHQNLRDAKQAFANYESARSALEDLEREQHSVKKYLPKLAARFSKIAVDETRKKNYRTATKAARSTVKTLESLRRTNPSNRSIQLSLANAWQNLAWSHRGAAQHDETLAAFLKAADILKTFHDKDPRNRPRRSAYGDCLIRVGTAYVDLKQFHNAVETAKKFVKLRQQTLEEYKGNSAAATDLSVAYLNSATWRYLLHDVEGALREFAAAEKLLSDVLKSHPDAGKVKTYMIALLDRRATVYRDTNRFDEAAKNWLRAYKLSGSRSARFVIGISNSLARAGRHRLAADWADKIAPAATQAKHGTYLYSLACIYAISARAAEVDHKLEPSTRAERQDGYSSKAVNMLKDAAEAGHFRHPGRMKSLRSDPSLNALRHRDDFRRFARSVGIKLPAWARKPRSATRLPRKRPTSTPARP